MHKHLRRLLPVMVILVGLVLIIMFNTGVRATDSPNLLTSSQLDVIKSLDVSSSPSSLNGNIDCIKEGPYDCVIDTNFGAFSSSGFVRRNKTSFYYELINNIENRARNIAIPNSGTIISYTTEPPYGLYLYFTKDFSSSTTLNTAYGTNTKQYKINKLYDGKLKDKANHRLAADYTSMSFSSNGQWMVVSMPNVAMLRVNLSTFEVIPFATGFNYTIGLDPAIKTAISADGRYVALSSKTFSRFEIYDLNSCNDVPDTINGPVGCQSRNLKTVMQQKIPGYTSTGQIRFVNNNTLRIYAGYNIGTGNKIAPFTIFPSGNSLHLQDYLALGDSYISGEGAFNYLQGTDTNDNRCHVSIISYPFLLASDLDYNSFHSVACSGARINDVSDSSDSYKGQAEPKMSKHDRTTNDIENITSNFSQGYINQLDFVTTYQPKIITLSIGGNDVGFSKILKSCIAFYHIETCYSSYEDRLELVRNINQQFSHLVNTYKTLKNASPPDTRIYVIGYPQIVKAGGNCGANVQLNSDELVFTEQLTSYLNTVINQAANKAGVFYVDTQNAFDGHRLCEAGPGKSAVNGITKGNDYPKILSGFIAGPLGNETYHPTPLGYGLIRDAILTGTGSLTSAMPAPDINAVPPSEIGLEILDAPTSGRSINSSTYSENLISDIVPAGNFSDIFVDGQENSLKPNTSYRLEMHSTPVILGNYSTDASGNLSTQITIPANTTPGFHSLHVYGTNSANEPIDIHKEIYVAFSANDYNGDGIPNSLDPCLVTAASGQDVDQDGLDDACDGSIGQAPPPVTPISSSPPTANTVINQPTTENFSPSDQETSESPATSNSNTTQSFPLVAPELVRLLSQDIITQPETYFSSFVSADLQETESTIPSPPEKVLAYSTSEPITNPSSKLKIVTAIGSATIFCGVIKFIHLKKLL